MADKKVNNNLQKVSNSIENNPELTAEEERYNNLKAEVEDLEKQVKPE
ncbi:hypothetical protein [Hominisplanchenecus sp.]